VQDKLDDTRQAIEAEHTTLGSLDKRRAEIDGLMASSRSKLACFKASEEKFAKELAGVDTVAIKAELTEFPELLTGGGGASQDGKKCQLCMDRNADSVFNKCGHMSCAECVADWFANKPKSKQNCPFCKLKVASVIKVFA
jgi:hypothetical protein